jgi:UDP-glucose:(heptosyl)LPS alpha-1,3-glucosyltransferase
MTVVALLKRTLDPKGGLETATKRLKKAFERHNCAVTLLSEDPSPLPAFIKLKAFDRKCQRWFKQHPEAIVFGMERTSCHTHYRAGSGVHRIYLKQRELVDPFFKRATFGCNPLHNTILDLEKRCFENRTLRAVFVNSNMVKQEIVQNFEIDPAIIEVVYNGAPYTAWQQAFEESLHAPQKETRELLFVGSGWRRKGLGFLLEALKGLSDFHLSVVGEDKERIFFERQAEKMAVTFYGRQDPLPFYQKANVLCIPSIYDPCANVTLEALAMGLFVVSSRFNGAHELLTPTSGTIIEDLASKTSLQKALLTAFNYQKTRPLAESIRNSVKELDLSLQWDKLVQKTIQPPL